MFEQLPSDALLHVLGRCDVVTKLRVACVSRATSRALAEARALREFCEVALLAGAIADAACGDEP